MDYDISTLRHRLEAQAGGAVSGVLTVARLTDAFLAAAASRWTPRRAGSCNSEIDNCASAFRPLLHLYHDLPAEQLNPVRLRAVQLLMVETGWCCSVVNSQMGRIKRAYRWATARMLVATSVLEGLRAVEAVRPPQAPMHPPVQPVTVDVVEATLPWLADRQRGTNVVSAMVQVQLLTGMRPGEVVGMRGQDVRQSVSRLEMEGPLYVRVPEVRMDTNHSPRHGQCGPVASSEDSARFHFRSGHAPRVWRYSPATHKNAWRSRDRVIPLGPRCQMVLAQYMRPGHVFRTKRGTPYSTNSYAQAIRRACRLGGLPHWSPNQLRHTGLTTAAQRTGGIEVSQQLAGHATSAMTQRYVQTWDAASEYARRYG